MLLSGYACIGYHREGIEHFRKQPMLSAGTTLLFLREAEALHPLIHPHPSYSLYPPYSRHFHEKNRNDRFFSRATWIEYLLMISIMRSIRDT